MSSSDKLKIPLEELSLATNRFAEANIIGVGGYGLVYVGQSSQHGMLAIKRLNRMYGQGDHEYGTAVTLLSRYKHENLVSLVGFCGESGERILAYKYEANGSLDKALHRKDLSWVRRLQICLDAACGLRHLHTGSEHGIIHRDVKSSNILLDENWKAKIADFGLSKIALTKSANSVIFTSPCGTEGYFDPQSFHGDIAQKSDVYSFGVVLYEVLFGKLVATPKYIDDRHFTVKMAKENYEEKTLNNMIDPDLRNQMNVASLSTFSSIAYQCLKDLRKDRPTMTYVVKALEKALGYQQGRSIESFGLSSSGFLHDVYISFRLEDSSTHIFNHLCAALESEGVSAYKGNINNPRRESILLSAIKQSRSFIIIFSKNFPAGSWNLEEVVEIMKCVKERGNFVLPVFCDVHPTEVMEQKGYFGEVMSRYDTHPKMSVWRNALVEATNVPCLQDSNYRTWEALAKRAAQRIKKISFESESSQFKSDI